MQGKVMSNQPKEKPKEESKTNSKADSHKKQLKNLLKGISLDNQTSLTDWGKPVGREIW